MKLTFCWYADGSAGRTTLGCFECILVASLVGDERQGAGMDETALYIARLNIARFERLLETERDEAKRRTVNTLLGEAQNEARRLERQARAGARGRRSGALPRDGTHGDRAPSAAGADGDGDDEARIRQIARALVTWYGPAAERVAMGRATANDSNADGTQTVRWQRVVEQIRKLAAAV